MRTSVLLLSLLLTGASAHSSDHATFDVRAVEGVAAFRTKLQSELKEAMKQGPVNAIAVCRDRAPRIASEAGSPNLQLGRSSERLRNPANTPPAWVEPILEYYASHPKDREARSVDLGGGRAGYAEPIVVQPLCLVCHGEAIAPAVKEKLQESYPKDNATGYREGDFRGVFWAVTTQAEEQQRP